MAIAVILAAVVTACAAECAGEGRIVHELARISTKETGNGGIVHELARISTKGDGRIVHELARISTKGEGRERVRWKVDFPVDMRRAEGIEFELKCDDLTQFCGFSAYMNNGNGCYTGSFNPREEGKWHRIVVPKWAFGRNEGKVSGWGSVKQLTLAFWRGGTNDTVVEIRNLRVREMKPEIIVVRGDASEAKKRSKHDSMVAMAAGMTRLLGEMGLPAAEMADNEIDAEMLAGVKMLVFPWNPTLPDEMMRRTKAFVKNGGKVLACYSMPGGNGKMLGLSGSFYPLWEHPEVPRFAGMVRNGKGLAGQPEFVAKTTRCCTFAKVTGEGEVLAHWADSNRKALEIPAVLKVPNGYFISHVWNVADGNARAMIRAIMADAESGWQEAMAAAETRLSAEAAAEEEWVKARKGKAKEIRMISCHSEKGPVGHTWDSAAKLVKDAGFTELAPNVAWASGIFEKETDEVLAACRKHGLGCWLWKVMWRPHRDYKGALPGRVQVTYDGKEKGGGGKGRWLCPSDPLNRKSEIEMCVKLAKKRPTAISLDYVRYPDRDSCFCEGCRAAFETRYGKVANWPKDLRKNDDLAAKWREFRCANITDTLREIVRRVRAEAPGVKIKASVFHNVDFTADRIGQDWAAWCREGLLDVVAPMDYYSGDTIFAFRGLVKAQLPTVDGTKVEMIPSLGPSCWAADGHEARKLCEQIEALREFGVKGFGVFELDARGISKFPCLSEGIFRR